MKRQWVERRNEERVTMVLDDFTPQIDFNNFTHCFSLLIERYSHVCSARKLLCRFRFSSWAFPFTVSLQLVYYPRFSTISGFSLIFKCDSPELFIPIPFFFFYSLASFPNSLTEPPAVQNFCLIIQFLLASSVFEIQLSNPFCHLPLCCRIFLEYLISRWRFFFLSKNCVFIFGIY